MISKRLEVKRFYSPDIENLVKWKPINNCVFYSLDMDIGFVGDDACDLYSVMIGTGEGITAVKNKNDILNQPYKIILLNQYSWIKVVEIIENILANITNPYNKFDIQSQLCRYFYWEYESMN